MLQTIAAQYLHVLLLRLNRKPVIEWFVAVHSM